ncbi:MAG TPA: exonuclease domain-containing protein [Burkholderiaceae bacterium]|nr:exonuclease domain-containing protein [Burkholderiaceae bacterium]
MTLRRYAFVDLETSGVSPSEDRITEIGIVLVDGDALVEEWSSLVNPEVPIPPEIQSLTGITNEMVRVAPRFAELLPEVARRLEGRVFVAHNARFDYGFLKAEFRRAGERFTAEVLCTVRLSRRLFPEQASHRLDALIERHGLSSADRHRALGDARAIRGFLQVLGRDGDPAALEAAVRELLRQPATPPHLPIGALDALPESPGIYVFEGAQGAPLYVGKARNLRERVRSHFYADSRNANDARLVAEVHALRTEPTAGEFGALLLEMQRIKACTPLHNLALRRRETTCFVQPAEPGRPPRIVPLAELPDADPSSVAGLHGPFGSRASARAALSALGREHRLCDRALGLWAREGPCFSRQVRRCLGLCCAEEAPEAHHARLLEALAPLRFPAWPFDGPVATTEHDPETGLVDRLVFDRWRALGPAGLEPFDPDVYKLLRRRLQRDPARFETALFAA